ncbi:hypothetical protein V2G26_007611 [Clonostachys chloroleuca]
MNSQTREDIRRMTHALTDQRVIQQLSESGRLAKLKREELKERRRRNSRIALDEPESEWDVFDVRTNDTTLRIIPDIRPRHGMASIHCIQPDKTVSGHAYYKT